MRAKALQGSNNERGLNRIERETLRISHPLHANVGVRPQA